jgi:hypothetical protein
VAPSRRGYQPTGNGDRYRRARFVDMDVRRLARFVAMEIEAVANDAIVGEM